MFRKEHSIWAEKYRPQTFEDYLGNEHFIEKLNLYLRDNDIPHLLLSGPSGIGKTSAAKILVNILKCDHLYINASDENSVDIIRTKIKGFASSIGFSDLKIIILDECLEKGTLVTILRKGEELKCPIEYLDEHNDLVKSFNVITNEIEYQPFYLWDKKDQEIWEIKLENDEVIRCTGTHKWYINNGNKIEIVNTIDLYKHNHILSPNDKYQLEQIKIEDIKNTGAKNKTYDITVSENSNFFIGNTETLTHNCDYLTINAQAALRNVIETFSKHTRFIMTCNYIEKIIKPIQSRLQTFNISAPTKKIIAKHVANILDKENVTYRNEDLVTIIHNHYPDIRKIIQTCQLHSINGNLKLTKGLIETTNYLSQIKDVFTKMTPGANDSSWKKIRQIIANSKIKTFESLYRYLYDIIEDLTNDPIKQASIIVHIAEAQYKDSMVVDKEVNVSAMFIRIINEI